MSEISVKQIFELLKKGDTKTTSGLRMVPLSSGNFVEQNPNKGSKFAEFARENPNILLAWRIPKDDSSWQLFAIKDGQTYEITGSSNNKIRQLNELAKSSQEEQT